MPKLSELPAEKAILLAEFEDLRVYENHMVYQGSRYALEEIESVRGGQSSSSFNFVPSERSSSLSISLVCGKIIKIAEDRVIFLEGKGTKL